MATVVGIAGSTRTASYNAALLRAAVELAPPSMTLAIESIAEIPLYNGDIEAERGVPESVTALQDRIAAADGLLLVTPEYNNSVPGVLKNTIDWLSRPPSRIPGVFGSKPVALMGATPGAGGTRLAQVAWLPILRTLGARLFPGQIYVAGAGKVFTDGALRDEPLRERVGRVLEEFAAFIARSAD